MIGSGIYSSGNGVPPWRTARAASSFNVGKKLGVDVVAGRPLWREASLWYCGLAREEPWIWVGSSVASGTREDTGVVARASVGGLLDEEGDPESVLSKMDGSTVKELEEIAVVTVVLVLGASEGI